MIKKKAYAKVNLFLNVLSKRRDGYHNLEMINAKIDLYDKISIKKCFVSTGIIIKSNDLFLSSQENVILQCAKYMKDRYHINYGIEIEIDKQIPYGAGLGGNSTDAASVIHGINELAELNLPLSEMQELGGMFGADIPYCLINDVAHVTSTGNIIEVIPNKLKEKKVLVINPKKHILTASIFKSMKDYGFQTRDIEPLKQAIENNTYDLVQKALYNSLENIVTDMDEEMKVFKEHIIDKIGGPGLVMTGSGSTFIKLLDKLDDKIIDFINDNREKYFINVYKII